MDQYLIKEDYMEAGAQSKKEDRSMETVLRTFIEAWGVQTMAPLGLYDTGNVYSVSFKRTSPLKLKKGVIVDASGNSGSFPAVISLTTADGGQGIPKLDSIKHRDDGVSYVLWDIDPHELVPLHRVDTTEGKRVVSSLLGAVSFVHDKKIFLGFDDAELGMQQTFFVHRRTNSVWLIDISRLAVQPDADQSLFTHEKATIISVSEKFSEVSHSMSSIAPTWAP
jgi:hypothetical protein